MTHWHFTGENIEKTATTAGRSGLALCLFFTFLVGCSSSTVKEEYPQNKGRSSYTPRPSPEVARSGLLDNFVLPWKKDKASPNSATAAATPATTTAAATAAPKAANSQQPSQTTPPLQGGGVLRVNQILWNATLDTLAFMPLENLNPSIGIVQSAWYRTTQRPNEQIKITVRILSRELRADALRVQAFRRFRKDSKAPWLNAPGSPEVVQSIEKAILSRARELRVATPTQDD